MTYHKPSDPLSAGDQGSQAAQIAKDLLHLADVRILMGQDEEVAAELGHLLGLSRMQRDIVTGWAMQDKGRALWMVGDQRYKVQTVLTPARTPPHLHQRRHLALSDDPTPSAHARRPLPLIPFAVLILILAVIGHHATQARGSCGDPAGRGTTSGRDEHVDAEQMAVATEIVGAVRAFGPTVNKPQAAVIALATARQESGLRNLDYGDRDSLGAFQQRPSQGWGTPAEARDVPHATTTFLQHLIQVHGWETMRVTDAAAGVQRPAARYRGRYERWVPLARPS